MMILLSNCSYRYRRCCHLFAIIRIDVPPQEVWLNTANTSAAKRVLLRARSVSSNVVITEIEKHHHNCSMASTHKEKQRTPPKASPTQRLVSNLPRGVTINGVEVSAQYATCPDCTLIGIVALRYHDRLLADLRPAYCRPMIDPISSCT